MSLVLFMAGAESVLQSCEARSRAERISMDEAYAGMSSDEKLRAQLDGMPAAPREAFLNAHRVRADRQTQQLRVDALARRQHLHVVNQTPDPTTNGVPMNAQNQTNLSQAEYATAQQIFARIAEPLSASELDVCAKLGMSPEAYKAERDRGLSEKLPGGAHGLDAGERAAAAALGMTEETFARAKAEQR